MTGLPGWRTRRASADTPDPRLAPLLLTSLAGSSVLLLLFAGTPSGVPTVWPAPGLLLALALVAEPQRRASYGVVGAVILLLAHLVVGDPLAAAVGFTVATVAAVGVARRRLDRGLDGRALGLFEEGDVSRLVAASATGAGAAAVLSAATVAVTGSGSPLLAAVAAWSTHAAALLVLVPLVVAAPELEALAPRGERVSQSVITLGATAAVFAYAAAPPLVFAVMPMFAWLAYRGTPREATRILALVALISSAATVLGLGPVHELAVRYDLAPELVAGFLQLFLIDCALLLLPLSVMAAQQRLSAARASAGRQTLQRLVDAATGSAVIATDLGGVVEVFNPGAVAMFGRPAESVVGAAAETLFTDVELHRQAARLGTQPGFADICAAAVASGGGQERWHLVGPDGRQRTVLITITPVSGDRGDQAGYLCVGEDVTEREAAHHATLTALHHERQAVERLTELERIKADFVATVSHELRTPLTSMIGYLELLRLGQFGEQAGTQSAVTERVERNSRRLLVLVEDLLLLSQIEAREMRLTRVPTDLRAVVEGALEAVEPLCGGRRLAVGVHLPDRPVEVVGDQAQLERMLVNLLGNAVKFTPDEGRVDLVLETGVTTVSVVVRDTGMGIPDDEQTQLFTRFFRSSTATEGAIQGTGLGLTIVQAIVDAHDGVITVSSRQDVGTTVTVRLPVAPPPVVATVVNEEASAPGRPASAAGSRPAAARPRP